MKAIKLAAARLAGLIAGVVLLAALVPVSAHEGYGSVTRWQYFCNDGSIEVTLNNLPRTWVWSDIDYDSHPKDNWGDGFTTSKTLTDAKNWCRSRMAESAAAKCSDKARTFGASGGGWWYETTAILYKVTYKYRDYYDSYGYHTRELLSGAVFNNMGSASVSGAGGCTGPSQPL